MPNSRRISSRIAARVHSANGIDSWSGHLPQISCCARRSSFADKARRLPGGRPPRDMPSSISGRSAIRVNSVDTYERV
jgi:hypothetical protein